MANEIEQRLADLGIILPPASPSVAAYVPWTREGSFVYVSGQLPLHEGRLSHIAEPGQAPSLEHGQAAARLAALGVLAQVLAAAGGVWPARVRCLRLGGFIAAPPNFTDHAKIMNGASELILAVLGEDGRHARSTIGVASLPLGALVEVEGLFSLS